MAYFPRLLMRVWATPLLPWGLVEARTAGLGPAFALGLAAEAEGAGLSAA